MKESGGRKQGAISPCAACKLLRRRCAHDCVFAPYFPADEPHKFASVHKVFGASNVNKMLQVLLLLYPSFYIHMYDIILIVTPCCVTIHRGRDFYDWMKFKFHTIINWYINIKITLLLVTIYFMKNNWITQIKVTKPWSFRIEVDIETLHSVELFFFSWDTSTINKL